MEFLFTILFCVAIVSTLKSGRGVVIKYGRTAFVLILIGGILVGTYNSLLQYSAWGEGELTQYLLPPHNPTYFFFYVFMRIWTPYMVSAIMALLILWGLPVINKRCDGKFFEEGENYLAAIVVFLMGHPGWLFYLLEIVGVYLVWHLLNTLLRRKQTRLPLYSLWAWIGIVSSAINKYFIVGTTLWYLLKI